MEFKKHDIDIVHEELRRSEERYHKMIAEVQDYAILTLNTEGVIESWNKGAEKIKGYTAREIIGKNFRILYSEEDQKNGLPNRLLEEARTNGRATHEGWRLRKDGTKFWGSVVITALHDDLNNVIGFTKVTRDLTERKITEDILLENASQLAQQNEELRRSEERYHRMIAEVSEYAIISLSKEGIIESWNKGAESIKGYSTREIIGKSFKVFYSEEDQKNGLPDRLLEEARTSGRAKHEGWRLRKDGTKFWGSVVITALHDDQNNVVGFTKVTRDLTDRKKAEDKLQESADQLSQQNKELERMNQELTSFAYVSSHDLQEPLRKIQTFITRLVETEADNISEKGKDYFSRIQNAANRMQTLIEDLLTYSRTNTDQRKMEETDLNVVLDEVKSDLKEKIDEKDAEITSMKLPTLNLIQFQFRQLLANLIGNSLKFSKEGIVPKISIKHNLVKGSTITDHKQSQEKKYHHIEFSDNGIGFEPEYNTKIFEVFQRLHGRSEYSGTGIGLAICKKIVENHSGFISAEGNPGVGATFHIYLPDSNSKI